MVELGESEDEEGGFAVMLKPELFLEISSNSMGILSVMRVTYCSLSESKTVSLKVGNSP